MIAVKPSADLRYDIRHIFEVSPNSIRETFKIDPKELADYLALIGAFILLLAALH
ncbi:hypothetical protein ACMDCR_26580 [Labrys okinawensis]|uniref:hypothetical protein n=1 Tax=Labrys okinawensis TaxID=346911 RepID=UPI0039BCEDCA